MKPAAAISHAAPVLSVANMAIAYGRGTRAVKVVQDVSFAVAPGEALGIVGESGCGKSQTMLGAMRLLPRGGRVVDGRIEIAARSVLDLSEREMRDLRGRVVAFISQDALSALNPAMTIGRQMAEPMVHYQGMDRRSAEKRCAELFDLVGIPGAASRLSSYPHELSGGMRQRALIAMAISGDPRVLIADEPTTALDVTIQAQILRLLDRLRRELGMALVLISHDLGVVAGVADRVAVMYSGRIVESAPVDELFARPRHPYSHALLNALPRLDDAVADRLSPIAGFPPDPHFPVPGCPFHPRCDFAEEKCRGNLPPLEPKNAGHGLRCWVDPWAAGMAA